VVVQYQNYIFYWLNYILSSEPPISFIIILYCLLFKLIFNVVPACSCKKFCTEEVGLCHLCVPTVALQLSGVGISPTVIGNICMSVLFMLHHWENLGKFKMLSLHSNARTSRGVKLLDNKHILIYCVWCQLVTQFSIANSNKEISKVCRIIYECFVELHSVTNKLYTFLSIRW
jgi:hypothetical protein